MNIKIENDDKNQELQDDYLIIAIDCTGIKVTNRGHQWIRKDKWNVINNKNKRYLKVRISVNFKSKKIISIKVTDEHIHDSKALLALVVENILKSDSMTQQ